MRPDQTVELHRLCSLMEKRRIEMGFATAEEFATAAKHSVSTWHAWRRKNPTSPKFFDLRDFMRVLEWDIAPLLRSTYVGVGSLLDQRSGDLMTAETAETARLMEAMTDEMRIAVRDFAVAQVEGRLKNPSLPVVAQGSSLARHK